MPTPVSATTTFTWAPGRAGRGSPRRSLVERHHLRGQDEQPAVGHGVAGVDGEVQEGVLELRGIALHHGALRREPRSDDDSLVDAPFEHQHHLAEDLVEVDRGREVLAPPREGEQLPREIARAMGGPEDRLGVAGERRLIRERAAQQLRVPTMPASWLLKSCAMPPRAADGLHLLGLAERRSIMRRSVMSRVNAQLYAAPSNSR
jgi:hypothetical protein